MGKEKDKENTTTWKKKIFSDTNKIENIDNDFQTMNMIHKIKKINKEKEKRKKMHNYKNIKILENIHEPFVEGNYSSSGRGKDGTEEAPILDPSAHITDAPFGSTTIPDDNYEGIDAGDFGLSVDDPRQKIIDFINYVYDAIQKFNYEKAKLLADAFSKNKNGKSTANNSDVLILQKYVSLFESIFVAYFFAYNLFYATMYLDKNGERIPMFKIVTDDIKNKSVKEFQPYKVILFFFTYALYIAEFIQTILIDILPEYFTIFLNAPAFMILSFLSLIYIIEVFVPTLRTFLIDVIMLNTKNTFVNLAYFYVLATYFIDFMVIINISTFVYSVDNILQTFQSPLTSFILGIFRFIIILSISVPVGLALTIVLCLFYFTSIITYPLSTMNISKIMDTVNTVSNINAFIKKSFLLSFKADKKDLTVVEKAQIVFNIFFDFVNSYIFYIVFLIMLIVAMFDYKKHIYSAILRSNLMLISGTLIFLFTVLCIVGFVSKLDVDRTRLASDIIPVAKKKEEGLISGILSNATSFIPGVSDMAKKNGFDPSKLGDLAKKSGFDPSKLGDLAKNSGFDPSKLGDLAKNSGFDPSKLGDLAKNSGFDPSKLGDLAKNSGFDPSKLGDMANSVLANNPVKLSVPTPPAPAMPSFDIKDITNMGKTAFGAKDV